MEKDFEINIHQTLHGYSAGHTLLASSKELTISERRTLLKMSDLSGPLTSNEFSSYLTGYPLSGNKYYVLARTWYAPEMDRAGCVWTQSLLIDNASLGRITDTNGLNNLFVRPNGDFYRYSQPLKFINTEEVMEVSKLDPENKLIWDIVYDLYTESDKSIIIPALSPRAIEYEILKIWNFQWPRLRRNFLFCSGSLGLRTLNERPFDLQVVPYKEQRSLREPSNSFEKNLFYFDINNRSHAYIKIEELKYLDWDRLFKFMYKYGSDVEGIRSNFFPLLKAYRIFNSGGMQLGIEEIISFIDENFSDPEEGKSFKTDVISNTLNMSASEKVKFLHSLSTFPKAKSLLNIHWDVIKILQEIWDEGLLAMSEFKPLLRSIDPVYIKPQFDKIVARLPVESWLGIPWISKDYIKIAVEVKPDLIYDPIIWRQKGSDEWLDIIMQQERWLDKKKFLFSYLSAGSGYNDKKVMDFLGNDSVPLILMWINDKQANALPTVWQEHLKKNPEFFFNAIAAQNLLSVSTIWKILSYFSPKDIMLRNIPFSLWDALIRRLPLFNSIEVQKIMAFLLSSSFFNILDRPTEIIEMVFQHVHDYFKHNNNNDIWQILNGHSQLGNSYNTPKSFFGWFFNFDENTNIAWDKCEQLRRALVSSIINNNWDGSLIARSIKDEGTFIKTIEYCFTVSKSSILFNQLYSYTINSNYIFKDLLIDYIKKQNKREK